MTDASTMTPLQKAYLAIERLQARLSAAERARRAPVAVVGMACRLPGGADDPEALWALLQRGGDAVGPVPADRWDADAYFDPDPDAPGKMYVRCGGFLAGGVDGFDAGFFRVSPLEAEALDPQQRLLLELAWEALERAGIPPGGLGEAPVGVYVGISGSDFVQMQCRAGELPGAYAGTGGAVSVAAGRIAYVLGTRGPALAIDTACSSSLVAVHAAVADLRAGRCRLALAGGVNVILRPESTIGACKLRAIARDGRCKPFDDRADGYIRSEGAGMVALRRLDDALAAGDPVVAVIAGSAVGHDGRSSGLTVPSGPAQEALLREALADAGVAPAEVGLIEAHGTGTALGDPIEVQALAAVLAAGRAAPALLGAIKGNLGHLEAAAGVAGLIKAALAVERGEVPPNLHFEAPNHRVDWSRVPLRVVTRREAWPGRRVAGVSSFGLAGTNAHVVLTEAPAQPRSQARRAAWLVPVSARSEAALAAAAERLAAYVEGLAEDDLWDMSYTTGVRREHHPRRAAVVGGDAAALAAGLRAAARAARRGATEGKIGLVFSPHGSQWAGMGRGLWSREGAFATWADRCDRALQEAGLGWSVKARVMGEDGAWLEAVDLVQPVLLALQVGLWGQLEAWGVQAAAVVGHSAGEVAAAVASGALTVEDAARVVVARTRLLGGLRGRGGAMAMAELPRAEALAAIAGTGLHLAASNGPRSVVLAGEEEALELLIEGLLARGVYAGWGVADVASHSPAMRAAARELAGRLAGLQPRAAAVPFYGAAAGAAVAGEALGAGYWEGHLQGEVRFWDAVAAMVADGVTCFVEVGPHPVLAVAIEDGLAALGRPPAVLATLRRGEDEAALLATLAGLYAEGAWQEFARVYPRGRVLPLPTYPWQRQRHWPTPTRRPDAPTGGPHPLLGAGWTTLAAPGQQVFPAAVSLATAPALADHAVRGQPLVPGALCVELARAAARAALEAGGVREDRGAAGAGAAGTGAVLSDRASVLSDRGAGREVVVLSDVRFAAAWWLVEGREAPAQVVVAPADGGGVLLRVASEDGGWRVHATARARVEAVAAPAGVVPGEVAARCGEALAVESMYAELAARGLHYGPRFRGVLAARRRDGEALVEVRPGPAGEVLDAAVLDACLQAFAAAAPRGGDGRTFVPAGIGRFWLRAGAAGEVRLAHATVTSVDEDELRGRVVLAGADGAALGVADELVARAVQPEREARIRAAMFATAWRPAPLPEGDPRGAFLVLGGEDDVGAALAARLRAAGARVTTVGSAPAAVERAGLAGAWRAVIVAWPATTAGPLDADGLAAAAARGPAALLRVAQELGAQARRDPPRLWCVTAGALATTDGEAVAPEQATVWGLRRSLAHELPELRCAAADVGARWGAAEVEGLARLVASETLEDEWALRGGRALVSRLSPRTGGGAGRWRARADRSYVVTGGLGGLGRVTAAWLVERGARHLALVGRGAPSAAAAAELAGLRARGVQVEVVQADVADPAGWAAAAARISAALPRVAGVFHAAGALDDGLARAQTPARLAAVMRPKVEGSAHLHAFACAQESEVFVMFASSAGLLGPVGQATYAAANAFEDALAQRRRAEGRHALAVDWGPWAEVGQAAAQVAAGAFAGQGLQAIAPADGLRALEILLAEDATHAAVLPIDGRRFQESQLASRAAPRLSELVEGGAPAGPGGAGEDLRARLRAAPPERRREALAAVVRAQIGEALKLPPARVPADGPLSELGIDSLTSLAVRNRLEACTGLRLSATVLWNYPTPAAIAEHLAERLGVAEAPAPAPVPDEAARLLGELVGEAAALDVAALQALLGEREG